jgi:hypothetical protein
MDRSQHHWHTADLEIYFGPREMADGPAGGPDMRMLVHLPSTLGRSPIMLCDDQDRVITAGGLSRRVRFSKRSLSVVIAWERPSCAASFCEP